MFYVYILQSTKYKKFYIGFTYDLKARLKKHNLGKVKATLPYSPWKIIFYEAYLNKYDALHREKYLKSYKGKTTIRYMLKDYFKDF